VELVGLPKEMPGNLAGHERVRVVRDADPEIVGTWAVHAWTPPLMRGQVLGGTRQFERVGYLGVPSVMPAAAANEVDGFVSPYVQVESLDRAEEWADALHHVLDDASRRARRSHEALRRADALDGPATAATVVGRFLGWARYRLDDPGAVTP
jgi:hypothetical protein